MLLTITEGKKTQLDRPTPFSFSSIVAILQLYPTKFHVLIIANET